MSKVTLDIDTSTMGALCDNALRYEQEIKYIVKSQMNICEIINILVRTIAETDNTYVCHPNNDHFQVFQRQDRVVSNIRQHLLPD